MNETIETIEDLKELLEACNKLLKVKDLHPSTEVALVAFYERVKKDIRELQVSKPIEDLEG